MNRREKLTRLCEGAIFVAAALVLSYLKIPVGLSFGGFGGSIDLVMLPLIFFAVRWGGLWGLCVGLLFGLLKYFFAGGAAVNWQSMLLDYVFAYGAVGLAGLIKRRRWSLVFGGLIGCVCRFGVHFISGVTIYAQYMPEEFLNRTMTAPWLYSILYNGTYMLPNTVIVLVLGVLLTLPLGKYVQGRDMVRGKSEE